MEKVELRTADIAAENAAKLAELFPDIVTEVLDEDGNVRHSIDVEALKAHVGDVAEDKRERYQFTWPGKQKARAEAIRPIDKTMRPCPEESVNWDTTENLYIEGDNLDALKILRETYAGKIKMIYIDPPYNTGHDFVYNDDFVRSTEEERDESGAFDEEGNLLDKAYKVNNESNGKFHSDWCSMMYPRLMLARDLLGEDGLILISIGDDELSNLSKLCDAIFGNANHVCTFIWNCSTAGGIRPKHSSVTHEYALCYAADKTNLDSFFAPLSADAVKQYTQSDQRGRYRDKDFCFKNSSRNRNQKYEIECPDGEVVHPKDGYIFRFVRETFDAALRDGLVTFKKTSAGPLLDENGEQASWNIYIKKYLGDAKGAPATCVPREHAGMYNSGTQTLQGLFDGARVFENVKSVEYLKWLIGLMAEKEFRVLDFFSGSATTAHAVMQLNAEDGGNRKFIMVQLPEVCDEKSEAAKAGYSTICEIGKERIRRAGAKIASEVEESNAQLKLGEEPKRVPDIGFRVLKIDSSNFEDVQRTPDSLFQDALFSLADNVKSGRAPEDILFQLFPKLEIPYTARIDTFDICGKTVYSVDDDMLVACFDREVPEDVVRAMAEREPAWAVLRDASFTGDDALANFEEIFKTVSPETKTRVV